MVSGVQDEVIPLTMTWHWTSDLKYALRGLRRKPLFALIAVASLGLGIGANTAIFNLLDQVLFRALEVERPNELVVLTAPGPNRGRMDGRNSFSFPMYKDLRDSNAVFAGLAARYPTTVNLRIGQQAEEARSELVSGNYFELLGIRSHIGRLLQPADDVTAGAHPVIVVSYDYWRNRMGGDQGVVGRVVRINNHPMTVIGVAPVGFHGYERGRATDLFVPIAMKAQVTPTWDTLNDRQSMWLQVFGRLKPDMGVEQAEAGLLPVYRPLLEKDLSVFDSPPAARFRQEFLAKRIELEPGGAGIPSMKREAGTPSIVLMSMSALVLLIACANVAGLLIARGASRQKEVAVRLPWAPVERTCFARTIAERLVLAAAGGHAVYCRRLDDGRHRCAAAERRHGRRDRVESGYAGIGFPIRAHAPGCTVERNRAGGQGCPAEPGHGVEGPGRGAGGRVRGVESKAVSRGDAGRPLSAVAGGDGTVCPDADQSPECRSRFPRGENPDVRYRHLKRRIPGGTCTGDRGGT